MRAIDADALMEKVRQMRRDALERMNDATCPDAVILAASQVAALYEVAVTILDAPTLDVRKDVA